MSDTERFIAFFRYINFLSASEAFYFQKYLFNGEVQVKKFRSNAATSIEIQGQE